MARSPSDDERVVALKKVNAFDEMDQKSKEKCLKEVRLLQSLDHPHIVAYLDSFISAGELYIIVEWAERGDLKRLIKRTAQDESAFSESECVEYGRQLASAIAHMHDKRILHRDLKPANIFLAQDGRLKVGDLGLGRIMSSQTFEAHSKVGTPLYMSPEVLGGGGYDFKSDVWALGCILYELATLKSPFRGEKQMSLYELYMKISKGDYPPLPYSLSEELRSLIVSMLSTAPAHRPSIREVLSRLEALCKPPAACVIPRTPPPQPEAERPDEGEREEVLERPTTSRAHRAPPLLVMDDIVDKLMMLDYQRLFAAPRGYPPLHRAFFAQAPPPGQRVDAFQYHYDLLMWLFSLQSDPTASDRPPTRTGGQRPSSLSPPVSREEALGRLRDELSRRGISMASVGSLSQLSSGYGEQACLVLNEVINQELLRRDFHFSPPSLRAHEAITFPEGPGEATDEEGVEHDDMLIVACPLSRSEDTDAADQHDAAVIDESLLPLSIRRPPPSHCGADVAEDHHDMIETSIEPSAWRQECDRVGDRLNVVLPAGARDGAFGVGGSVEVFMRYAAAAIDASGEAVRERLEGVSGSLGEELETIRLTEGQMNDDGALRQLAEEATTLRASLATAESDLEAARERVTHLTETLEALSCRHDDLQDAQEQQAESHSSDEAIPRMRDMTNRLRDDIRALDIRIGVASADLLRHAVERRRGVASETRADEGGEEGDLGCLDERHVRDFM
ncbi:unnamed protein product [Vitrella brassicaformis CCMP3155]|uniref:non-specific serine/threonine protein kinase n=1 Tax=Vitrella brassicaformis (strain CCMP3155) TaxID=1169540 RepID=A0A0G4FXE6_VITBC|nr:unnamed protein product [Vitrella brassicaformis CCMP3155]|eukprot:CEM19672.1 unnamed protein product [Vitrella brassicaformis CCMP3155]